MLIGISITLSLILLSIPQLTHAALIDDIARGVHCTVRTLLGDTTCTIPLTTATTLNAFTQPQQSPPQPTTTIIKPVERVVHTREVVREAPTLAYAQLANVLATIHDDVADIQVRTTDVIKEYQHTRFGDDALWRAVAHSQRIDQLSGDGLTISGLDCSTYANGGTLTTDNNGTVVCAADDNTTIANTDNQTIDTFTFSGDTISLSLEDDDEAVKTIDLSTYTNDTDINTQAALEAFITDVTNVFTNTDTITDTNISDTLTIGSSSTVADGALSANVSLLGQSIDISDETNLTAGTNLTLTDDTLSVDDAFLSNTGDSATGDYNFDANTLFIDSSTDRVGVGTGSPVETFHVNGTAIIGTGNALTLREWVASDTDIDGLLPGSTFGSLIKGRGAGHHVFGLAENDSTDGFAFITGGGDYTTDSTYDTMAMYINAGGNVGIGTTSPVVKLDVDSGSNDIPAIFRSSGDPGVYIGLRDDTTSGNIAVGVGAVGDELLLRANDQNAIKVEAVSGEALRIDSSGNIGIGTTNPTAALDVSISDAVLKLESTNAGSYSHVQLDGVGSTKTASLHYGGNSDNTVRFGRYGDDFGSWEANVVIFDIDAPANALVLTGTGALGVGTNSPGAQLEVGLEDGTTDGYLILNPVDSANEGGQLTFGGADNGAGTDFTNMNIDNYQGHMRFFRTDHDAQSSYAEYMRITSSGDIGIGTTSPDAALDVVGDIHYTGTITDVSDERLKNNITNLTYGLNELLQLQPISFTMLNNASSTPQLGFTAQNVNDLFPEAVSEIDDGFLGLDYTQLIAPLVNGVREVWSVVQEHASVIGRHTSEISELRAEVAHLKAQLGAASVAEDSAVDESTEEVTLTLIGNDPAEVPLSTEYSDLGVVAQNAQGEDISYTVLVDDVEVSTVELDTSVHGTYTITYAVTMGEETVSITRTVIVGTGEAVVEDSGEEDIVDNEESVTEDEEEITHDADNTETTHDDENGDTVEGLNEETLTGSEEIEDIGTEETEVATETNEHEEDESDEAEVVTSDT